MSFYLCAFRSSNNDLLTVNYIISTLEVWWSLSNRGMLETLEVSEEVGPEQWEGCE